MKIEFYKKNLKRIRVQLNKKEYSDIIAQVRSHRRRIYSAESTSINLNLYFKFENEQETLQNVQDYMKFLLDYLKVDKEFLKKEEELLKIMYTDQKCSCEKCDFKIEYGESEGE